MKKEKLFYYIVTNVNEEVICYSTELLHVYSYLENFYKSKETGESITTNITRVTPDENGHVPYLNDKSEYLLVELCDDIVVTSWEYVIWIEYFRGYYDNIKNLLYRTAIRQLGIKGNIDFYADEMNDYLKSSLGSNYYKMVSFEVFFESLDKDEIKKMINEYPFSKELYYLNKEYNRKIFDDK